MTNEKARVSQMETVIARMNNKVYADQKELMQAVLEVLCKTQDYDFKYHMFLKNHAKIVKDRYYKLL